MAGACAESAAVQAILPISCWIVQFAFNFSAALPLKMHVIGFRYLFPDEWESQMTGNARNKRHISLFSSTAKIKWEWSDTVVPSFQDPLLSSKCAYISMSWDSNWPSSPFYVCIKYGLVNRSWLCWLGSFVGLSVEAANVPSSGMPNIYPTPTLLFSNTQNL